MKTESGWIEHDGGECPKFKSWQLIEVEYENGIRPPPSHPDLIVWSKVVRWRHHISQDHAHAAVEALRGMSELWRVAGNEDAVSSWPEITRALLRQIEGEA